ncbi:MAG: 16S rRNA (adenine(1518)-N(6)/adenine(1519)-N(6))-dimethyltransferase RsmA [Rhodospirillales bacterium]|nr:16S rRNA (adenine(1518)-N(6)/adenine(1519)-N(6))-dimethyltransferase RsmA [Rhodospirillales bacterium]MSP79550.1 16S rRNA (adenine(1518)-N(6)/adenine(1519)-N(6))-dimethyltransferase RsmA [Rhodospirillales bacterium]
MNTDPAGIPPLRDVIRRFELFPRRSLGQHFLLDPNLTARIARAAGDLKDSNVIEVGPGPGGLTRALLAAGARVTAVEKDSRCVAALRELEGAYPGRLRVIEMDALAADARALVPAPRRIVANLPYNIAAPLLIGWLKQIREDSHAFARLTLMFQKEVAERLFTPPGSKVYGRLSVMTQWLCDGFCEFDVSPKAFVPPPKVTSAVVTLIPRAMPLGGDAVAWPAMERTVAAAFGQRRKMLRQSLKRIGLDPEPRGIEGTRRAETLSVEEFVALAK